jgi:hypothetical protein
MPLVGFEPTIPALERAKTLHALDRATTVIGISGVSVLKSNHSFFSCLSNLLLKKT